MRFGTRVGAILVLGIVVVPSSLPAQERPRYPGVTERGFLLPNGWTIAPAGDQVPIADMPLNIVPLADSRHALVATSGFNKHELSVVDLKDKKIVSTEGVRQSWFGLAVDANQQRIWWSGGGAKMLHTFAIKDHTLSRTGDPEPSAADARGSKGHFQSGVAFDAKTSTLYSLDIDAGTIMATPAGSPGTAKTATVASRPYDVVLARNGSRIYVSDWSARLVLAVDPAELRVVAKIPVGEHPNQIAVHPHDDRLFVACASSNSVAVIDTKLGVVTETIVTTLFPKAPEGSTPDALVVAPDGKTLYVANADNNCVAVVDISATNESRVKGFVPTGWYPSSLGVTPDGKMLLVGVGKGNQTRANPIERDAEGKSKASGRGRPYPYIGTTLSGALSLVPVPDEKLLAAYTETVYKNCPYSDNLLSAAPYPRKTAIPTRIGDPSPIKHVIYIIKENRTYDQVFGDLPRGNGDPSLVMFGREVTPNHHKLAEEFVLLDNLYCNGHVSADGHPWSTMAYNTDYVARNWALTYSGRAGIDDDDERNLAKAPSGYLWDACARNNLSYRSYGEYGQRVSQDDGTFKMEGAVPGLVGHMSPEFGVRKVDPKSSGPARDPDKVAVFLEEFRQYEQKGDLPRFIVMSLGEDHTTGTRPGTFTPQACVASNDLALARLVDGVSHSKYWPETAIFVIEDDAQNGPDHVDAHRTVGLVISPYTRKCSLDSTQYSTVSMLRTIELILGIPPLSQYDAAATPMFASFTDAPDPTPYTPEAARIDLNAKNGPLAFGAEQSSKMDFSEYDRINDFELNAILWGTIKGPNAPVPPAVRRAIAYRPAR